MTRLLDEHQGRLSDKRYEMGDFVDRDVELYPLPADFFPPSSPLADLNLHYAVAANDVVLVLPASRSVFAVFTPPPQDAPTPSARVTVDPPDRPAEAPAFSPARGAGESATSRAGARDATVASSQPTQAETVTSASPAKQADIAAGERLSSGASATDVASTVSAAPDPATARPQQGADAHLADPPSSPAIVQDLRVRTLLEKAEAQRIRGDILAARLLLERAVKLGSRDAMLRLADTYDAAMLAQWKTHGVKPDQAHADRLYRAAEPSAISAARAQPPFK